MLERATGCLENAGQRFLWHSGDVVRSRRALRPRFWHHGEHDMPAWCFAFLQSAYRVPGRRRPYRHARTPTQDDSCHMHLDFLYPSHARTTARSGESKKHNLARRRGKLPTNSSRSYASGPPKSFHQSRRYNSSAGAPPSPVQLPRIASPLDTGSARETPSQRLKAILQLPDPSDYDEAWTLYQSIENHGEFILPMFEYLARSLRGIDVKRLQDVFLEIPVCHRTQEQYSLITETLLRTEDAPCMEKNLDSVKKVVQEAVSHDRGAQCWSLAFVYCVKEMRWKNMQDLWQFKPLAITTRQVHYSVDGRSWKTAIPKSLATLTVAMEAKTVDLGNSVEIPKFLLYLVFCSKPLMRKRSIKWILNMTQNLHNLGLLEPEHYSTAIATLSRTRGPYDAERSMLLYRNFCWRMTTRPPITMLTNLIFVLYMFHKVDEISFAVNEFRFFYGILPPETYRVALSTLARAGDVSGVDRLFELFRREHGDPEDPLYYYLPYLHVYARLGRVDETRARFENLQVFGAEQNLHCWNVLLTAYANAADSHGAFSLFDQMRERGLYNSHTIGTLMGMCAKHGDTDEIDDLFKVAADCEIPITASFIDASVESCLNNGRFEDAEKRAEEGARAGYAGDLSRVWNLIIVRYAYRYDIKSAMRVKERMDDIGIRSTSETCSALILAFAMVGRTDEARIFLREMHRGFALRVTEFHYSILLTGYARERNRDMIHVIYREMTERFPSHGLHTRVPMLQAQIQRDLRLHYERGGTRYDPDIKLVHTERFLKNSLDAFNPAAPRKQQNGVLSFGHTLPGSYYVTIISAYGEKGAFERVDTLFNQINSISQTGEHPLRLLSVLMKMHVKREQYDKVCACWDMAFKRTTLLASRSPSYGTTRSFADIAIGSKPTVYPAYRFVLNSCISYYLQALGHQNLHSIIPAVVQNIEEKGFLLSTQNWSMYIKMLATSENAADQFHAFTTFEEKFIPNYQGWENLIRMRGKRPPGAPARGDIVIRDSAKGSAKLKPRKIWAGTRPEFNQPTYTTVMYLATALLDFRERSVRDEGAELSSLYEAAPKTFIVLTQMPKIKEKFQDILIRNRDVENPLPKPVPFSDKFVSTEGVLGDIDLFGFGDGANEEDPMQGKSWGDLHDHEEGG